VLPEAAAAVNVTDAPDANGALHVPVTLPLVMMQLIPAGLEVTVPLPVPDGVTLTEKVAADTTNVTGMVSGLFSATEAAIEIVAVYCPAASAAVPG
jgi:hypothetical protein